MEQHLLGIHFGKTAAIKAHQIIAYLGGFVPERTIEDDITISFVREKNGVRERLRVLGSKSRNKRESYRLVLETEKSDSPPPKEKDF